MELTPVKVRGKRRAQTHSASSSRSSTPSTIGAKRHARLGTNSKPSSKRRKTASTLSQLEQLPAELLQCIFLHSMNISLPQSSPRLASQLSSEHVFLDFSIRALCAVELRSLAPESHEEYVRRQSQLLQCRFFTWSFYNTYAQRAYKLCNGTCGTDHNLSLDDPPSIAKSTFNGKAPVCLQVADGCHVPDRLLKGPWTADKTTFLYSLIWLGAIIDWTGSSAGETATQGLYDAIREGSTRAVASLLSLANGGVKPTTDMVRYAVKGCGCNCEIVSLLMNTSSWTGWTVDFQDPELRVWAAREKAQGNPRGDWLQARLEEGVDVPFLWGPPWQTRYPVGRSWDSECLRAIETPRPEHLPELTSREESLP